MSGELIILMAAMDDDEPVRQKDLYKRFGTDGDAAKNRLYHFSTFTIFFRERNFFAADAISNHSVGLGNEKTQERYNQKLSAILENKPDLFLPEGASSPHKIFSVSGKEAIKHGIETERDAAELAKVIDHYHDKEYDFLGKSFEWQKRKKALNYFKEYKHQMRLQTLIDKQNKNKPFPDMPI